MTQKKCIKGWFIINYHVDPLTDDESTEKSDTLDKDENVKKKPSRNRISDNWPITVELRNWQSSASFLHLEVIHGKKHGKVDSESFRWIPNWGYRDNHVSDIGELLLHGFQKPCLLQIHVWHKSSHYQLLENSVLLHF